MNRYDATSEYIVALPLRLTLNWRGSALTSVALDWAGPDASNHETVPSPGLSPRTASLHGALARYLEEGCTEWPWIRLDFSQVSPFAAMILETLRTEIGPGETISYGDLATLCGCKGAARAIGQVMATNPWPLLVPCHRVRGADGRLGGFSGAGPRMKSFLLRLEGSLDTGGELNTTRRRSTSPA